MSKSQMEQNQNQQSQDKNKMNNSTKKAQVSVNSVKSWRNEAEALKRPPNHLKAIDNVMAQGKQTNVGNKKMVEINQTGLSHMKQDKQDYQKLSQDNKSQESTSHTLRR